MCKLIHYSMDSKHSIGQLGVVPTVSLLARGKVTGICQYPHCDSQMIWSQQLKCAWDKHMLQKGEREG